MADITERLALQPEDIGGPSRMDMLRERIEAKAEIDRLRSRVAELEVSASEVFTAMLVEIDGHTYGLRPGAARIVKEALADDPELDCTDFAKPAWWRGEAYGSSAAIAAVTRILDGKDDGRGVANEPWQSVRTRLREALRDAGRYRWLRDATNQPDCLDDFDGIIIQAGYVGAESILIGGDLDAAIDAAMAKDGNDCTCSVIQTAHGHHAGCPAKDGA